MPCANTRPSLQSSHSSFGRKAMSSLTVTTPSSHAIRTYAIVSAIATTLISVVAIVTQLAAMIFTNLSCLIAILLPQTTYPYVSYRVQTLLETSHLSLWSGLAQVFVKIPVSAYNMWNSLVVLSPFYQGGEAD